MSLAFAETVTLLDVLDGHALMLLAKFAQNAVAVVKLALLVDVWRLVLWLRTMSKIITCQAKILIAGHTVFLSSLTAKLTFHMLDVALKIIDLDPRFYDVRQDDQVWMVAQVIHLECSLSIHVSTVFEVDRVEALLELQLAEFHSVLELRAKRLSYCYLEYAEGEFGVFSYCVCVLDHGAKREFFGLGLADVQSTLDFQQIFIFFDILLCYHFHGFDLGAAEQFLTQVLVNWIDLVNTHASELSINKPQVHFETVF